MRTHILSYIHTDWLIQSINRTALIMIMEGNNKKQSIIRAIEAKLRILGVQPAEAREIAQAV